jgi:Bax protein
MKINQDLFEQRSKNNLLKIFLSSFLTISFFYIAPIFINFADKNFYTKEVANNSKKILAYTLNKEDKNKKENETLNEEEVIVDIYSLKKSETEAVYLSAASIDKLFKETDYNLNDVRQKKLVKPVALTLLPNELIGLVNFFECISKILLFISFGIGTLFFFKMCSICAVVKYFLFLL